MNKAPTLSEFRGAYWPKKVKLAREVLGMKENVDKFSQYYQKPISQESLARRIGCTRQTVVNWEKRGRPPMWMLEQAFADRVGKYVEEWLADHEAHQDDNPDDATNIAMEV